MFANYPTPEGIAEAKALSGEGLAKAMPDFVADRKKLMPQPERWTEFVDRLKTLYLSPVYLNRERLRTVPVPFLLVQGEHDPYASLGDLCPAVSDVPSRPDRHRAGLRPPRPDGASGHRPRAHPRVPGRAVTHQEPAPGH